MRLRYIIRETLRKNEWLVGMVLFLQSLQASIAGRLVRFQWSQRHVPPGKGVALCLRFRDEGFYLREWIEYHRVAGVAHFFLYNNESCDNYLEVLEPYMQQGLVTLVDWDRVPVSPSAEEDCVRRARGRFAWVGFIDADEFIVVQDDASIEELLARYTKAPGVALPWRLYGSAGHVQRPSEPVIQAYRECYPLLTSHIKTFLRPERAAMCRNSHSWFYTPWALPATLSGRVFFGSMTAPDQQEPAWLNHYYCKSRDEYLAKAMRASKLDLIGIKHPSRTLEKVDNEMLKHRECINDSAIRYYLARCARLGEAPSILEPAAVLEGAACA